MKRIIIIISFLCVKAFFAQGQENSNYAELQNNIIQQEKEIEDLTKNVSSLQVELNRQIDRVSKLLEESEKQKEEINSLNESLQTNTNNIKQIANDLGTKIQETETTAKDGISKLDKDVSKNRLYWVIATLILLLLGVLMYVFLGKRIKSSHTDVEAQIKNTQKTLGEEALKLDNKLIEVLETQLKLKQNEKQTSSNTEIDHSLALKVADEIVRIQKNLNQMDANTKGLKQLSASVKRIQDNFAANGYELVDMLGKEYNEGMKATVNFIQDEDAEKGKRTIVRIIKPQVNYKGEMIQVAQIDVSEN